MEHFGKVETTALRILWGVIHIVIELKPFVVEKAMIDFFGRFGQPRFGFIRQLLRQVKRLVRWSELIGTQSKRR